VSRTQDIDKAARKTALALQSLMAQVDFQYNRHQQCIVCKEKFVHHIDGLPCESDDSRKQIIRNNRWNKNLTK
jgi:hypothetical protein|tara:strand:+ start:120 stop:338 length:219 start_codon:yes stop_codon:yes gene_type:complete